jgi:hypothetical protein
MQQKLNSTLRERQNAVLMDDIGQAKALKCSRVGFDNEDGEFLAEYRAHEGSNEEEADDS